MLESQFVRLLNFEGKAMNIIASNKCHGGYWKRYQHFSNSCQCEMTFSIYFPSGYQGSYEFQQAPQSSSLPALFWLSGLTCNDQNFVQKAHVEQAANQFGFIIIAPDTSPRGIEIEGQDDTYDFGSGAGFYLNATREPWAKHYQMETYISQELYAAVVEQLPVDHARVGIFGHSMGGHGALTLALNYPEQFRSVSAFAPICHPVTCDWGKKAFSGYLQTAAEALRYDACELIKQGKRVTALMVDQGDADEFLAEQLGTEALIDVCQQHKIAAQITMRPGYDHSYFFIASFVAQHLAFHAEQLTS